MEKLFSKKDCGEATLITVIVLIVVAIGLLVFFRNEVYKAIQNIMGKVTSAISALFNSGETATISNS